MALTKNDKKDIGEIVGVKVSKEIGLLRLEINQRFDATDKKIDNVEHTILEKIDEVKKMESEDVQALAADIEMIKGKLPA